MDPAHAATDGMGSHVYCGDVSSYYTILSWPCVGGWSAGCNPSPHGANPATWMLEVTGGALAVAAKAVKADWPALYSASSLFAENGAHGEVRACRHVCVCV